MDKNEKIEEGADDALIPQLPTITVVTPCESLGSIAGRRIITMSLCA